MISRTPITVQEQAYRQQLLRVRHDAISAAEVILFVAFIGYLFGIWIMEKA